MQFSQSEQNGIAYITLYRPEKRQALDEGALSELMTRVKKIAKRKTIEALILSSDDARAFSAGLDLFELKDVDKKAAERITQKLHELTDLLEKMPQISIAAIDGYALGAGMEIAIACDFRVAGKHAILGLPQVGLGFTPGGGSTQRLPKLVGSKEAQHMIIDGNEVKARNALNMGLVDKVVIGPAIEGATIFAQELCKMTKSKRNALKKGKTFKDSCPALPKTASAECKSFIETVTSEDAKVHIKQFCKKHRFF